MTRIKKISSKGEEKEMKQHEQCKNPADEARDQGKKSLHRAFPQGFPLPDCYKPPKVKVEKIDLTDFTSAIIEFIVSSDLQKFSNDTSRCCFIFKKHEIF